MSRSTSLMLMSAFVWGRGDQTAARAPLRIPAGRRERCRIIAAGSSRDRKAVHRRADRPKKSAAIASPETRAATALSSFSGLAAPHAGHSGPGLVADQRFKLVFAARAPILEEGHRTHSRFFRERSRIENGVAPLSPARISAGSSIDPANCTGGLSSAWTRTDRDPRVVDRSRPAGAYGMRLPRRDGSVDRLQIGTGPEGAENSVGRRFAARIARGDPKHGRARGGDRQRRSPATQAMRLLAGRWGGQSHGDPRPQALTVCMKSTGRRDLQNLQARRQLLQCSRQPAHWPRCFWISPTADASRSLPIKRASFFLACLQFMANLTLHSACRRVDLCCSDRHGGLSSLPELSPGVWSKVAETCFEPRPTASESWLLCG